MRFGVQQLPVFFQWHRFCFVLFKSALVLFLSSFSSTASSWWDGVLKYGLGGKGVSTTRQVVFRARGRWQLRRHIMWCPTGFALRSPTDGRTDVHVASGGRGKNGKVSEAEADRADRSVDTHKLAPVGSTSERTTGSLFI